LLLQNIGLGERPNSFEPKTGRSHLAHDGGGAAASRTFRQLSQDDRKALLEFLAVL